MSLLPRQQARTLASMPRKSATTVTKARRASEGHLVVCVGYDNAMSLDIAGPLQVFATANDVRVKQGLKPWYLPQLVAKKAGVVNTSSGLKMLAEAGWRDLALPANCTVLIPGGDGIDVIQHDEALRAWLQRIEPQVMRLGSVCSGALVLARAGLLDGCAATTHWCRVDQLREMNPDIAVDSDRLHTFDADHPVYSHLFTSAGVTAGIDLSLYLLAQDHGPEVALSVAKRLVVFTQRSGGQSQFSPFLVPHAEPTSAVALVQHYVLANLTGDLTIADLANAANMSARNFSRVFAKEAKITPAEFVERARVDAARVMLESTGAPLKTVAYQCGFRDAQHMRSVFNRRLGVTPQQFRLNFAAMV